MYHIRAHSLAIESGRYKNIPQKDRDCITCSTNRIEDEIHFFIECPKYVNQRQELTNNLSKKCKNLNNLTANNLFLILNSNSIKIIKAIIKYINKCQE